MAQAGHLRPEQTAIERRAGCSAGACAAQIQDEEDVLWKADERESTRDLTQRGVDFLQWLMQRPEQSLAVVSHSSFLLHMLSACGMHREPPVQVALCDPPDRVTVAPTCESGAGHALGAPMEQLSMRLDSWESACSSAIAWSRTCSSGLGVTHILTQFHLDTALWSGLSIAIHWIG